MSLPEKNARCPCGSGKKFKNCCAGKKFSAAAAQGPAGRLQANLEMVSHFIDNNQFAYAEDMCRQILQVKPAHAQTWFNLGMVQLSLKQGSEAVISFQNAIKFKKDYFQAMGNLGLLFMMEGKQGEAAACFRKAIALKPDYVAAHCNLGLLLMTDGKHGEAIASFRKALTFKPDYAEAHNNLGIAYQLEAHGDVGGAYQLDDKLDAAVECYRRALALKPDYVEANSNLGGALVALGKLDAAIESCGKALALDPCYVEAHNNLGSAFQASGKLGDAIECYRNVLSLKPDHFEAYSKMLFCHNYHPTLSAEDIFQVYRQWNDRQMAKCPVAAGPFLNVPDPARRLKIGYVSADFRRHTVSLFAAPLIEQHDKSGFDVHCYYNHTQNDDVTDRIKKTADHWIPCRGMSDEQLARQIRDDGIDVLIDLAGHTGGNRLQVFARKAAPVQASWLGYGYTTGLTAIDYFIGDAVFTPAGSEHLFSEKLYRLPHVSWTYRPPEEAPAPGDLPALRNGYVTLACLSRSERINSRVIAAWAKILQRVPNARLRLDSRNFVDASLCDVIRTQFAAFGVSADRLMLGYTSPVWDVYREVDIVLDCFPHNSGTTTYEALWMGVPVITLADRPSVGRMGASILSSLGRQEWIAAGTNEYVARAAGLAHDLTGLEHIRAGLRQAMRGSCLLDHAAFARDMEKAFRDMWETWCAEQANQEAGPAH